MRELRRNLSILKWSGVATIVFEIWSIIKFVLFAIYYPEEFDRAFSLAGANDFAIIVVWVVIILLLAIDAVFRIYVGSNAIKASKGKRITNFYITVAIMILLATLYSIVANFALQDNVSKYEVFILSFVVDVSSAFINIELLVSAIKVKGLVASNA